MSQNTKQPKEHRYTRWQLAKDSSIHTVHKDRGDEDERRNVWVGEDDYLRLKKDYDAATKATFDAIRTITQLRDENECLKKAGDAMRNEWIDEIRHGDARKMSLKTIEKLFPRIAAWNAAKEGNAK